MSRLPKIVLAACAALLIGMIAVAIVALLLIDPNEYRDEIEALALEQTGRTLTIDGELGLRVFPCCSVAIDDTRLGNPADFKAPESGGVEDFASVRSIRLGLQLLPLLFQQRVVVDEVVLDGLAVNLLRLADGTANWEFETEPAPESPAAAAEVEAGPSTLPELSVAGIRITEARLELRDETAGTHVAVEELSLSTGPIVPGEPVGVDARLRARDFAGDISVAAALEAMFMLEDNVVTVSELSGETDVTAPDLPGEAARIVLQDGAVRANLDSGNIVLERLAAELSTAGVELVIDAGGSIEGEAVALSGGLAVAPFSPRKLLANVIEPPVETTDPGALAVAELQAAWSLTATRFDVSSLTLVLDDSTLTGEFGAAFAGPLALNFDVDIDAIDVDRYLPPETQAAGGEAAGGGEAEPLPVEALRDLDVDGRAAIGRLVAGGLTLQNFEAVVRARDGLIRVEPTGADVYDGRYEGRVSLDVTAAVPKVRFTQSLESVQSGGVLADLYDTDDLEGLLQARIDGSSNGVTTDELMANLQGAVVLDLEDAVYKGADVWYEIRRAVALAKGKPGPAVPAKPQTRITALGFAGKLTDGILRSDRLTAEIPFIRIDGVGDFDLPNNRVDYDLKARMLSRPDFADADDLADLERVTIPIEVTGDAADPKIVIDLAELAKDAAVQKGKDRLLKKLGLDEPDEAGDGSSEAADQPDERDERDEARDLLKKGLRDLLKQ